jgi:hypothetical protein
VREPDVLPTGSGASWNWWGLKGLAGRRRGTAMLVVTVLCLAVAVGLWSEPTAISRTLVQPRALLALLVADIGLLVFRVVTVLDAYLLRARGGN